MSFAWLLLALQATPSEERKLAELLPEIELLDIRYSPSGAFVIYEAQRGDSFFYVVNGEKGEDFDWVGDLRLSADGNAFAYKASKDGRWFVVTRSGKSEGFERLLDLLFSSDGKHLAYAAESGEAAWAVLDGVKSPACDGVHSLRFSPDGRTLAYVAENQGKHFITFGAESLGAGYDLVSQPAFSPDGKRFAYVARRQMREFVVVDGRERALRTGGAGHLVFSPDGRHLAYEVWDEGQFMLVLDDAVVEATREKFSTVLDFGFSPEGKLHYTQSRSTYNILVIDGKIRGGPGEMAGAPLFSADGKRQAWLSTLLAEKKGSFVVIDGVRSPAFEAVSMPVFSPDGRRLAWTTWSGGERQVVKEKLVLGSAVRTVLRGAKERIVVDAVQSPEFDHAGPPQFLPDGRIAFGARQGKSFLWKQVRFE